MTVVSAGTRLGPYEVVSRVGAGGMGEVWKARDTRLDRSVAIKILPPGLAADAQFRQLVHADRKDTGTDVEIMDGSGKLRSFVRSDADDQPGSYSPDGKWIAYWPDESGRNEVYVRPRSGAAGRWQISNRGGTMPRWVLDDEIAYLNGTKRS